MQRSAETSHLDVGLLCIFDLVDANFWDDEKVNRRLWTDIIECQTFVVVVDHLYRDFLVDNFIEYCWAISALRNCTLGFGFLVTPQWGRQSNKSLTERHIVATERQSAEKLDVA